MEPACQHVPLAVDSARSRHALTQRQEPYAFTPDSYPQRHDYEVRVPSLFQLLQFAILWQSFTLVHPPFSRIYFEVMPNQFSSNDFESFKSKLVVEI